MPRLTQMQGMGRMRSLIRNRARLDATVGILTSLTLYAGAEKVWQLIDDCKVLLCHADMRVAR